MAFDVLELSITFVTQVAPLVARLERHDRDLADQLRRAANGIGLQVSEAVDRKARDSANRFRIARASAVEATTALRLGVAWGHLADADCAGAYATLDRLRAMLWRLMR